MVSIRLYHGGWSFYFFHFIRVPLKKMSTARRSLKEYGVAVEKVHNRYATGKAVGSEGLTNYQDVRFIDE